jgi:hypothetical protein
MFQNLDFEQIEKSPGPFLMSRHEVVLRLTRPNTGLGQRSWFS